MAATDHKLQVQSLVRLVSPWSQECIYIYIFFNQGDSESIVYFHSPVCPILENKVYCYHTCNSTLLLLLDIPKKLNKCISKRIHVQDILCHIICDGIVLEPTLMHINVQMSRKNPGNILYQNISSIER